MAEADGLDVVEIDPNAEPPVCRLMDFGRFVFDQRKKKAEAKKKQRQVQIKEIKFRPGTDEGDYQVKLRNLTRFLTEGDKGKVTMRFRGREHAHRELGLELLKRVETRPCRHQHRGIATPDGRTPDGDGAGSQKEVAAPSGQHVRQSRRRFATAGRGRISHSNSGVESHAQDQDQTRGREALCAQRCRCVQA